MFRILKAAPADEELSHFDYDDLGDRGARHVEAARREAEKIVAAARAEVEQLREQARAEGRAAARAELEQLVHQRAGEQSESLAQVARLAVDELRAARTEWLVHWEHASLRLATAIASRVIRREVERSPEITLSLVREALELAAGSADLQVRMHPDDLERLGPQLTPVLAEFERLGQASLVADPAISSGGCRVETRHGTVDQQFEVQLARIEQELS